MNEKLKNAVIINGEVYALYDDPEPDECTRCALREDCGSHTICVVVFGIEECIGKRFYRIELY
jgi:hypothetical protein